ncbi:phytanoyl-CoA dioxygenase family protein [Lojkania enalia]|uniref:Phytanoyl-CoA dioxygenase family protein n=1 Tax=Lojkania enalia TaxID=147567 RepID=A0A9P4MYK1_9PLEO|nr:phytanoyl-CoA dioxygenase family protein [Didymosphaeria enalia]
MATTTTTATTTAPPSLPTDKTLNPDPYASALESLHQNGYAILPASLFPSLDLPALRTAATRLTDLARAGQWPYIRTLPKQFPPWPSTPENGIWGVQHLLHPSNPSHLLFARSYFSPELCIWVSKFIGCREDELVMELYNMLVRPDRAFSLRWHRDDIPASATPQEELDRLARPAGHTQWNLALYPDSSLVVIPGSHRRARTDEERVADPYSPLPHQKVVELKAGEVVFYNNNILHRGVYDPDKERLTLHGSMGSARAGQERARNVLQHGVGEWVGKYDLSGFDEGMRERAERMRDGLVRLGERSGEVEYFSKDE